MKKLSKILFLLGLSTAVLFTSCSKDDESIEDATITITASPTGTLSVGSVLTLTIEFKGNDKNKLKSYTVTRTGRSTALASANLSGTSANTIIRDTLTTSGNFTYIVTLVSEKGNVTKDYTATVEVPATVVIATSSFILGNQADSKAKFWSGARSTPTVPAVYFLSNAVGNAALQADIDFAYCTRSIANGGNKIISPNSNDATDIYSTQWSATAERITNWTVRNNTLFIQTNISSNVFYSANTDSAITALIQQARTAAGEPNNQSIPAIDDKVYLYKTQSGLYGLFALASPTGTVNASGVAQPGEVAVVAKYQKLP